MRKKPTQGRRWTASTSGTAALVTLAVTVIGVGAVAGCALLAHAVVDQEQHTILRDRVHQVALTSGLAVETIQSDLSSVGFASQVKGPAAFAQAAAPFTASGLFSGVAVAHDVGGHEVVSDGVGNLAPGTVLSGPEWAGLAGFGAGPDDMDSTGIGGRGPERLVGLAMGAPVVPAGDVLVASLVTEPTLERIASSGQTPLLEGLGVRLYASNRPSPTTLVMAAGDDQPAAGSVVATVSVGGLRWTLLAWAERPLVGALTADLPWIVLAVGLALWVLFLALRRSQGRESTMGVEMSRAAVTDPLTELPNRRRLHAEITRRLATPPRDDRTLAAILLDLDDFKAINETLGHEAGDRTLMAVADRLRDVVRDEDFVARLGGDEFVVLCAAPERAGDLEHLVTRILTGISAEPLAAGGLAVVVRATAGVAVADDPVASPGELLRKADTALYAAKADSKGSWQLFNVAMQRVVQQRFSLFQDLNRAIDDDDLALAYQPVLDISTNQLIGVEALLRWHDKMHDTIPTGRVIEVAEGSGLIAKLTAWVLRNACEQAVAWHRMGVPDSFTVAVNVSAKQLYDDAIVSCVSDTLAATGCAPHWLTLEITETCLIDDPEVAVAVLGELRGTGVSLSLDDFGTGYSSLSHLSRLPVDIVKVDRSILVAHERRDDDGRFMNGICYIAKTLGARALAEGVETEAQLALVRSSGFDLAQGYLLGRPRDAASLTRVLESMVRGIRGGPDGSGVPGDAGVGPGVSPGVSRMPVAGSDIPSPAAAAVSPVGGAAR